MLFSYKNGGTWCDDCYVDAVDEELLRHLKNLVARNKENQSPFHKSELQGIAQTHDCLAPDGSARGAYAPESGAVATEVLNLFKDNRFVELVRKNVQKFHVGDWNVADLEMLSIASLSVVNTSGLQPKLSGESGKGKTHAAKSMLHLIHQSIYKAASFSSKALFYDKTLTPKSIIFSDDVNLSEDVDEIVRKAMSNWDTLTQHITLDSQRKPTTLTLPPRIVFWLTSVKTTSTLQLLNRQVEMNVDESPEQDRLVERHQRMLSESGLPEFYDDDEVKLLRGAFLHLNQIDFTVKIPFMKHIKFSDVSNRRNLPIFLDLIKAYCVLNYKARLIEEDGSIVAAKEDFDNALELFKTIAIQQVTKLNEKERQISAIIKDNTPCDIRTIMDETGLSNSYVYELIHGDRKSNNRGLFEKIPKLKLYPKNEYNEENGHRWGRNHYSLPENWSLVSNCESIVYWEDSDDQDQFRSISDNFGEEFRNSENGEADLDAGKNRFNWDIADTTGTNFVTSQKNSNLDFLAPNSSLSAAERNSEMELHDVSNSCINCPKRDLNKQINLCSISETTSEVDRQTGKAKVGVANDQNEDAQLSLYEWHPSIVVPRRIKGRWITYVKMRVLDNVPKFIGVDGNNYQPDQNEEMLLPESNAKLLWQRKLAVLITNSGRMETAK